MLIHPPPPAGVPTTVLHPPASPSKSSMMTLKVLSLNVFGLPQPIGKNIAARSRLIGQHLPAYDLIGLQETFSRQTAWIRKQLSYSSSQPYYHYKPQAHKITSSGLEVFSKYPILKQDFKAFQLGSNSDALAKKGVAFVRVMIPGIGPLDFYDTHYQAENDKPLSPIQQLLHKGLTVILPGFDLPHEQLRLHDNQILVELFHQHDQGYPAIFTGDFNTPDSSVVYQDLTTRLQLQDAFRELNPDQPGFTSDGVTNPIKKGQNQKRIDFIFYRSGQQVDIKAIGSQVVFNQAGSFVSDHFGVRADLNLSLRQGAQ